MHQRLRSSVLAVRPQPACMVIALFEGLTRTPVGYHALDAKVGGALGKAIKRAEFGCSAGSVACLYPANGFDRLYILGLGVKEKFTLQTLRAASAALAKKLNGAEVADLAVELTPGLGKSADHAVAARALGEGLALGAFVFDQFRGSASNHGATSRAKTNKKVTLTIHIDKAVRSSLDRGLLVGESTNLTRTLAATPPNIANPKYLVDYCRKMARQVGLKCNIIDAAQAKRLGMGGLTAVGQAGSTSPALICLEWSAPAPGRSAKRAKGKSSTLKKQDQPILLVGKAITFDTGGYSLKPSASMLGMKYDKCGGMAVIGAMHAIASLKLPRRVVGVIAAAENMVDSTAYRPNDILTMYNGVTVEVTNTDAEGRLVLADALAYGCKQYQPKAVVDLATLTGGVVVALGSHCAGLFVNDASLREQLMDAADASGERLWCLPLWDEHRKQMKGTHSDLVNSSPTRGAHPITGAAFLSYFAAPNGDPGKIDQLPWAHLDIAGVASTESDDNPLFGKGPTGFGVRLLVHALESNGK